MSPPPLIRSLADFIDSTTWAGLPSHVQASARDRLLDAMSTAVASRDIDVVRVAAAAVESGADGACTILPSGATGVAQDAAFLNAVAVHALLFEDIHLSSADHPGAVVVPAALAAAEDAGHVAGCDTHIGDLLTAIVVGYELQLFLGAVAAQGVIARGFRTTSVFGTIAAAAAAAHLWRLPPDRIEAAVAIAANLSFGLIEAWSHGSMEPYLQVGVAARNGLLAALLGRSGAQTAGPTFEGPNGFLRAFADTRGPEAGEDGLGDWRIGDVSCKPYPVSGAKLSAVDSALAAQEQGLSGSRIRAVTVYVPPLAKEYPGGDRKGPFSTMSQAQDSAQFCVAAALLGRPMSSVRTFTEGFGDEEVSDLTQRIEIVSEPGRVIARVDVELDDGSHIVGEIDSREGHRPTIDRMAGKLRELSGSHWASGAAGAVIDVVCGSPDRPVADLSRLLRS